MCPISSIAATFSIFTQSNATVSQHHHASVQLRASCAMIASWIALHCFSEDDRKLFVGGLPQEAKDLDIKEYFGQYGEIDNINLKTDPHTGRSRGFAFIVFKVN